MKSSKHLQRPIDIDMICLWETETSSQKTGCNRHGSLSGKSSIWPACRHSLPSSASHACCLASAPASDGASTTICNSRLPSPTIDHCARSLTSSSSLSSTGSHQSSASLPTSSAAVCPTSAPTNTATTPNTRDAACLSTSTSTFTS